MALFRKKSLNTRYDKKGAQSSHHGLEFSVPGHSLEGTLIKDSSETQCTLYYYKIPYSRQFSGSIF